MSRQKKESMKLMIGQLRLCLRKSQRNRKKRMKKYEQILWDNSSIPTHTESQKEGRKTVENTCEKVWSLAKLPKFDEKNINLHIQETEQIPSKKHLDFKTQTHHNQTVERTLKNNRKKHLITYRGSSRRLTTDFSPETMEPRIQWDNFSKC